MSSAGVFSKVLCVSFPVLVLFRPRGIDSIYISFHLFQLVFVYTINSLTCKHHKLKVLFLASLTARAPVRRAGPSRKRHGARIPSAFK
jgi:hypothetical protein